MDREERRRINREIFNDTKDIITKDKYLKDKVKESIENVIFYSDTEEIDITGFQNNKKGRICVTTSSSFDSARTYNEGKTAVLNFASATTPGGGVTKGSTAQEEALCRSSTLYNVLTSEKSWNSFYTPHRKELNALHNDDILWTPNIIIIKTDDYKVLSDNERKEVDVITCAAPNLREHNVDLFNIDKPVSYKVSNKELFDIHYKRASKIFRSAIVNNIDNVIVGAFGCGAFQNDPLVVAQAWKKVTEEYKGYFNNIEFAVYCKSYNKINYDTFKRVLDT